jgi:glycosyltransferase involved in cell wall biosynthesis
MNLSIICGAGMVSGKEIMALELGRGLRQKGHSVAFVSSLWGDGAFHQRLAELGFTINPMRLGFISATLSIRCLWMTIDQLVRLPSLWLNYRKHLQYTNPEQVIHTNWHHLLMLWPFLTQQRDWFWVHEVIPNKPQYRNVFGALDRRLRGWIVVSQATKASLLQIGIPDSHIHVVHNGITDPTAIANSSPKPLHQGVRIGIAGQVSPWKGHRELFKAFALLNRQIPQTELHVFGTGPEAFKSELQDLSIKSGFANKVRWHGFLPNRSDIYSEMDIFVVPSIFEEPFGLVAVEAAFFGLPCVVGRSGGLPEIVAHSTTGFITDVGAVNQLADFLAILVRDPALRLSMGAAARTHAVAMFSVVRLINDFETILASNPPS